MTPEEREGFLRDHPEHEWRKDECDQRTLTTDAELDFLRDVEDATALERLKLDYELLRAIIEGFTLRRPNMGEDELLACPAARAGSRAAAWRTPTPVQLSRQPRRATSRAGF
jgi:hypothetical protein